MDNINEELKIIIQRVIDEEKEKYPILARMVSSTSSREKIENRVNSYIVNQGIDDVYEAVAQVVLELENSAS